MEIVVDDAVLVEQSNGAREWLLSSTVDDAVHYYSLPASVFAWRVAEYDLDPDNVDGLVHAVLYEVHMVQDPDHPLSLGNAPTIDEAREHYLQQVAAVKAAGKVTTRRRRKAEGRLIDSIKVKGRIIADNAARTDTPLMMLKAHIAIDPEHVAVMRESLHRHRALIAQR